MLGFDDDKDSFVIEDEYALAFLEEYKTVHPFNEKEEEFYQKLREDVHNKIKRNLTFVKISKDEKVKTNQEHGTVQDTENDKP